jgi:PIN domain nuclease of toxin-antitoxin system
LRLLLDTHALIWALAGSSKLSGTAHDAIASRDNEILVSAASAMEVTTKFRLGKLPEAEALARAFEAALAAADYVGLPVSVAHAAHAGRLAIGHKDPFDRLLIAQALIERVPLISNEKLFDTFGVERIW